jgi:hypothetical protein
MQNNKRKFAPVLVLIIFISCTASKTNNHLVKRSDDKSIYYYEQPNPFVHLSLLGDYKFQSYKTKYFRDIDCRFIEYSKLPFYKKKPIVLYAAHTCVQPFYSSILVLYNHTKFDTLLFTDIKQNLKKHLKTSNHKWNEVKCGKIKAYKISYQVVNKITKIYTTNLEYLFENNDQLYRLFLWTTNENDNTMANEAEYIIAEAVFK